MRFFGLFYAREEAVTDTPVGRQCDWCDEPFVAADSGILLPGPGGELPYHRACFLRRITGSLAHLERRCSCFGGSEDDPPGMTLRQEAEAAVKLFESRLPLLASPSASLDGNSKPS